MRFHQVKLAVSAILLLLAGCGVRGGAEGPLLTEIAGLMKPADGVYLKLQGGVLHATQTIRGDKFEIPLKEVTISGGGSNIGPLLNFRCKGLRDCIRAPDSVLGLTALRHFHMSNSDAAAKIASKLRELAAKKPAVSGDWYAKRAEVQAEARRKSAETRAYWAERSRTGGGSRSSGSGGLFKATEGSKTLERIRRKRREQERENARIRAENRRKQAEHRRRREEARVRAETRRQREEARREAEYKRQQEENRRRQEEARRERQARLRQEQELARQRREHEQREAARRQAWVAKSYSCSEEGPSPGMGAGYIRNMERMRTDTDWRVCRASVNASANDFYRKCASKKRACNAKGGKFTYDVFVRNPKIGSCEHTWEASWKCAPYQPWSFTPNLGTSGAVR